MELILLWHHLHLIRAANIPPPTWSRCEEFAARGRKLCPSSRSQYDRNICMRPALVKTIRASSKAPRPEARWTELPGRPARRGPPLRGIARHASRCRYSRRPRVAGSAAAAFTGTAPSERPWPTSGHCPKHARWRSAWGGAPDRLLLCPSVAESPERMTGLQPVHGRPGPVPSTRRSSPGRPTRWTQARCVWGRAWRKPLSCCPLPRTRLGLVGDALASRLASWL